MKAQVTKPFPYFVGIHSLEELITRESRVCVINILGSESRKVTPVSHEYSGGNVVAGVQYGRRGDLDTAIGKIPVFRSVLDVVNNDIPFDVGVIYLPPAAVSQAVWELVTYNKELKRIVIVTEKVPSRDSRNIRFTCQEAGVDVIGANCLGVANVWDHARVGGALGGDRPEEALKKGSIAIYSNSGNFTTTIAEYLKTGGFGVSTVVSSGKDVYIHFALPEFLYAAQNDPRTKAVALYIEPGGYYEKQALDWIQTRVFGFNKPIVVCVTGRWKKDIVRACGHAGAMAGGGDDAESKENWFDEYFETSVFDSEKPKVTKKGIRILSIQQFPEAMKMIFKKIGEPQDFKSTGDLSLKLWIGDSIQPVPEALDLKVTRAIPPYDHQIAEINKQVGAQYMRQNMRNTSGASRINPKTQVAELHGVSLLDLAERSVEENIYFTLAKVFPEGSDRKKINFLLNLFLKIFARTENSRALAQKNRCKPNAYLASQLALLGEDPFLERVRFYSRQIIDIVREYSLDDHPEKWDKKVISKLEKIFLTDDPEPPAFYSEQLLNLCRKDIRKRPPMYVCQQVLAMAESQKRQVKDQDAFLLASLCVYLFWNPMLEKRISRQTVEDAATYLYSIAGLISHSVIEYEKNAFLKRLASDKFSDINTSFSENIFRLLFCRQPVGQEVMEMQMLLGLTLTNGPGTISVKGAKESVSARNAISLAFTGFLCNTGLAHGGNGFEAVQYLIGQFESVDVADPGNRAHGLDLKSLANKAARIYGQYKQEQKETGKLDYKRIPCINHPVFKGNDVNIDPREGYIRKRFEEWKIYNIFLDFYHYLVKELFNEGVTSNVFCVNIDAVLAVITLKLIWNDLKKDRLSIQQVQDLVFVLFLIGRSIGVAAEIADHRDRGQDMDCRTPQREVKFIL